MNKLVNGNVVKLTQAEVEAHEGAILTVAQAKARAIIVMRERTDIEVLRFIDKQAQSLGYKDIDAIAKYQGYDNPKRSEAESLGNWSIDVQDAVDVMYEDQDKILIKDVLEALPKYK